MKLSELYPTTKITLLDSQELILKFTFRGLMKMEELVAEMFPGENVVVGDLILRSFQEDFMPGKLLVAFLRACSEKSAEEIIEAIDTQRLEEYRRAILKAWTDSYCNKEQLEQLEALEEAKKNLIDQMRKSLENPIPNLNYTQPCPGNLAGLAKLFWIRIKESVIRLFLPKPKKK